MKTEHAKELEHFMQGVRKRNPHEMEFHQAVEEIAVSLIPYMDEFPKYKESQLLERLTEPDRIVSFRVIRSGHTRVGSAFTPL